MNLKGISVDFDDVLYDLTKINIKYVNEKYGILLKPEEINSWTYYLDQGFKSIIENVWNNPNKYLDSELIEGALEFYKELEYRYGKNNVQIVTSTFPNVIDVKNDFIKNIFDKDCKVIHTSEKEIYTKDTILIDDSLKNIARHIEINNNPAIIFDLNYGWNSDFKEDNLLSFRAKSYEKTLELIEHNFIEKNKEINEIKFNNER